MALEVSVGPPRLSINHGYGVFVSDQDGQAPWPTDKGFYHCDTRMISSWYIYADGVPFDLLNSGAIAHDACRIFLTNRLLHTESATIQARTISLSIGRSIAGGVHEDLDLFNHGQAEVRFNLEIALRSDFADIFEVKSGDIVRRGRITTTWSPSRARLVTAYKNKDFIRQLITLVRRADSEPVYANGRISFALRVGPGKHWHACLLHGVSDGETIEEAPKSCIGPAHPPAMHPNLDKWRDAALKIRAANEELYRFYRQSVIDVSGLRLPIEGTGHLEFVPAGGVPWFVALFGRDSLIVSLQNAMVYPAFAHGALDVLGRFQAKRRDDWRDAEPGKILHEYRRGELAHFKLIPHTPYYGSADATILYLIVLHSAWRSTGDRDVLSRHLGHAERCLKWIDDYGDRDGDGFQEYQTRSKDGYENQGWKDSGDALVDVDGGLVKGPKALVELQGYVYDAWLRMAQIYRALGQSGRARTLEGKAARLFDHFNEAFWDEDGGFYAFCLDGEKRKILSVASNPGHCLWSGIVPPERAAKVVHRLMRKDMWSGWGIRTLSADHPAFNPHSYQNGSVWPHDNGIIALGFRRYGFAEEANRIARDISGAASYFMQHQAPELWAGPQRDLTNFPVQYLGANTPQAWAAGSCFALLQMIIGFQPDAPAGKLYLDPVLPEWLPELDLIDLHLGEAEFDISLRLEDGRTTMRVLRGDPDAIVHKSFATGPKREI